MASQHDTHPFIVLVTVPDEQTGRTIATAIVEKRLAACVNSLPGVSSMYRWEGKIEESREVLLMIKTTEARFPELQKAIEELHPYDVPEIIGFRCDAGAPSYCRWVADSVS